ncbi:MAG: hypothetical protein O9282_05465 [Flavobacterium sp.]|uniref:hypothetical protein n=1 Tax=Flavobacterium sp. TaxID=239 RepID=UPI0022CD0945|nr:hypothetical protein [Flavobacterium sp.]MCZ8330739.1 hypothetical protein [Flavobacterium sp.]
MEESNWVKFKKWIYKYLGWIFMVLSLSLLLLSFSEIIPSLKINQLIEKLAFALLSSGVFAVVLKSIQFTGLFKEEIEKVILGTNFIKNRRDLPELWRAISKEIYKRKFPNISEELENRILGTYFPTNSDYYYEDYVVTINIEELNDDFEVTYTQTCKYNVILDQDIDSTNLTLKTSIKQLDGLTGIINDLEFFKINGVDATPKEDDDTLDDDTAKKFTIPLEGKGPFKIHSKFRRKYSLKTENYKLFRMNTFTKNMDVSISYPDNVCVSFFNIGNVNFFEKQHTEIKNQISRSHKNDVLLPYQGFGMSFEKI